MRYVSGFRVANTTGNRTLTASCGVDPHTWHQAKLVQHSNHISRTEPTLRPRYSAASLSELSAKLNPRWRTLSSCRRSLIQDAFLHRFRMRVSVCDISSGTQPCRCARAVPSRRHACASVWAVQPHIASSCLRPTKLRLKAQTYPIDVLFSRKFQACRCCCSCSLCGCSAEEHPSAQHSAGSCDCSRHQHP